MWLLDANMPLQLVALLNELGVEADCAVTRGWNTLSNGRLVEVAVEGGFSALLTRDKLFGESAANVLNRYPEFCVVRVALIQARRQQFLSAFRAAWHDRAIVLEPGRVIDWPST